jgi:oligo-1,6-glucosidase
MVKFRKTHPLLTYGAYSPFDAEADNLFIYFREDEQEKMLILLNFSNEVTNLPEEVIPHLTTRLLGNYPERKLLKVLHPWEACVYQC